ncbi:serine/threonine protein kinase, partial [Acidobacteria bacterium AH-259-G07]|nr:serine/threonine protein kinase [Acidobacteria bacterium AH-259-G07]
MIGQTISHYKILEKIGQGGMGEVFLAEDTSLDRKVALKFLPDFMQEDPTARKRFLREAKSAAALDHPYICHIHEIGEADGKNFIAMEYVEGQTLKDKLAIGSLPLKEALNTAAEIAEALETAHEKNIVHRDLKPSNIMLTPKGHVKVMDFGLAKRLVPAEGVGSQAETLTASLTKTGATLGTLAYMSPEQLRGEEVDTRSDIFSFG